MTDTRFEVLHLDDQPELVAWIPRAIATWFWMLFRADMAQLECADSEDDSETDFLLHLRAANERLDMRYRIFKNPGGLLAALASTDLEKVILILLDQAIGENASCGSDTYKAITARVPSLETMTFLLSAYPKQVYSELCWSVGDSRLIIKPADPDLIVPPIINNLIGLPGVEPLTRERLSAALRENAKRKLQ